MWAGHGWILPTDYIFSYYYRVLNCILQRCHGNYWVLTINTGFIDYLPKKRICYLKITKTISMYTAKLVNSGKYVYAYQCILAVWVRNTMITLVDTGQRCGRGRAGLSNSKEGSFLLRTDVRKNTPFFKSNIWLWEDSHSPLALPHLFLKQHG